MVQSQIWQEIQLKRQIRANYVQTMDKLAMRNVLFDLKRIQKYSIGGDSEKVQFFKIPQYPCVYKCFLTLCKISVKKNHCHS